MLKISQFILEKIGIKYVLLLGEVVTAFNVTEMLDKIWKGKIDNPNILNTNKKYIMSIRFANNDYESDIRLNCEIFHIKESFISISIKNIEFAEQNENWIILQKRIENIQTEINNWSRRKEERFTVGLKNSLIFGLKDKKQKLFDKDGNELDCAIMDVSFHGLKIVSIDKDTLQIGTNVILYLAFTDKTIILKCIIQNKILANENSKILNIFLKNLEDNIDFMERIEKYSKKIEKII